MKKNLGDLTTRQRKALPASSFALPALRKFPIHDAAHTRAAASRLEAAKKAGTVSSTQYVEARKNIAAAAKKFGVESQYLERVSAEAKPTGGAPGHPLVRRRGLHLQIGLGPNGQHRLEILHAASDDAGTIVRCDAVELADIPGDLTAEAQAVTARASEARAAGNVEEAERLDAEAQKLLDDSVPRPVWNQLAKVGSFRGHPAGPFELTPSIFDEIIANFLATENRRIPVDFEHASEADASSGSIPSEGAPAQGWIIRLENRGASGLWGLIEWLEPARTYVRQKKYRYFSPAIRFGARDRVTGKPIGARMTSGALTNNPFLDGMQPLAARDSDAAPANGVTKMSMMSRHEMMGRMKACMGLHPLASYSAMKQCVADMREHAKPILERDKTHAAGFMAAGANLGDFLGPLAEIIGGPAHMTIADILDAVESIVDSAIEHHEEEFHNMADLDPNSTTLTPPNDADLAVQLGETKEKLRTLSFEKGALSAQVSALTTEKAALSLSLRDEQAARARAEAEVVELKGTITTMKADETRREEQSIVELVDEAFFNYQSARNLTDEDKKDMMILARADKERFKLRYPRIPASQVHLTQNLTSSRTPTTTTAPHTMGDRRPQPVTAPAPQPGGQGLSTLGMLQLKDRLINERKMSDSEATTLALAVAKGAVAYPFAN